MGKSTYFFGQPMYNQLLKLLDKSEILKISRENGGERYTKRFNGWIHLVVMLYAVIKRFDSLRKITTSLLADTNRLAHLGISFKTCRSMLAEPANVVRKPFLRLYIWIYMPAIDMNLYRTADVANSHNGWIDCK